MIEYEIKRHFVFLWLPLVLFLSACEPSENKKREWAEQRRIQCLDQLCPGDVQPRRDHLKEEALKLNGQWFIGPLAYFSTGTNGGSFFWPSKSAARPGGEFPEKHLVLSGRAQEAEIEIFLRTDDRHGKGPSMYQVLMMAQAEGRVIRRISLTPQLEVWRVRDVTPEMSPVIWYVALERHDVDGSPPALACIGVDLSPERDALQGSCSMSFVWQPGIVARIRFHAKHGPDWPEIHAEVVRVLKLLNKVNV